MRVRVLFGVMSVIAVVGMLWGSATPARACSCAWPSGPSEQFFYDQANLVVMGTVTEMVRAEEGHGGRDWDAIFSVRRYFKGLGPAEVQVDDPDDSAQCGLLNKDAAGQRWVLFLLYENPRYVTHSCMGGISMEDEGEEAQVTARMDAQFGPGKAPSGHDLPYIPVMAMAVLGPLAFLVGAAFLWRPSRASG